MRWILFALTACALLAASSAFASAENDPRLEKILAHWKKLPKDLQSCRLSGRRFVYDMVFQVEKRAEFEIGWEKDGRAIIRTTTVDIAEEARSERLSPQGKPFVLRSDVEEDTWYLPNRQELIQVTDNGIERCALRIENRASQRSNQEGLLWSWDAVSAWSQIAIEFPIHPALTDLTQHLNWEITREDERYYRLSGTAPEDSRQSRNFKQIELFIDKSDFSIIAMMIVDPAGTKETVYRFHERQINPVFAPDAEIFNIHEPLRAPKPDRSSGLWKLFAEVTVRLLGPWFP